MQAQLRQYTVKQGQMAAFVSTWRDSVVPARAQYGFRVVSAWYSEEESAFGWLVVFEGDGSFEDAERAYYESPERAALPTDPASFLDAVTTRMVHLA